MAKPIRKLEDSYGAFNTTYAKLRRMARKAEKTDPSPEGTLALQALDELDAVLEDIFLVLDDLNDKVTALSKKK